MAAWVGHGAHMITYPVGNNKFLNVAAFVRGAGGTWPDYHKQTVQASKSEIMEAFSKFSPTIRGLVDQLPEEQSRWGLFDTLDHPLQTYAYGLITVAGDAAHGSSPHHGLGAGMGVEDALTLATVLEKAAATVLSGGTANKSAAIASAFKAYDTVRRERSQYMVASSRRQGLLVKLEDPEIDTAEKFMKDTNERVDRIYSFDLKETQKQSIDEYERELRNVKYI
jgi:salicylate hydroxylase